MRSLIRPRVALCTRDCNHDGDFLVTCPCDPDTVMHCLDWSDAHHQAHTHVKSKLHQRHVKALAALVALAETEGDS